MRDKIIVREATRINCMRITPVPVPETLTPALPWQPACVERHNDIEGNRDVNLPASEFRPVVTPPDQQESGECPVKEAH